MEKTEKIWLDGELIDWDDAKVHVLAHALNYGTAVFEGIRVYQTPQGPAIFRLKDHVKRLIEGCKVMGFDIVFKGKTYNFDELVEAIKLTIRSNKKVDYIKPCIFLSGEEVGLNPVNVPLSMSITCIHMGAYMGSALSEGTKLIFSSWHRPDNLCSPVGAKINGTYVTSCLAKREAINHGANEAVMLNSTGHVAECTGQNIFMYKNGKIFTPSTSECILEGLTRDSVIKISRDMGYEVIETQITRTQLLNADEVWMTGSAAEVSPVTFIDGKKIGDGTIGKLTTEIQTRFHDVVSGKVPEYDFWLDYI